MRKGLVNTKNFMFKAFAVAAVFTLIAFLLTLDFGANTLSSGLAKAKISGASASSIQVLAGYLLNLGLAVLILLVSSIIVVPLVKFSLIAVGLSLLYFAIRNIIQSLKG